MPRRSARRSRHGHRFRAPGSHLPPPLDPPAPRYDIMRVNRREAGQRRFRHMADYDNRALRAAGTADAVDAGLRAYMQRVYNYMFLGLAVTGAAAYGAFLEAVTTNAALAVKVLP